MGCGCDDCKKKHRVKRRIPATAASILYLLGQTKKKPSKISFMKAKRKVHRKKRGGKYIKNKKVTKVPRRRVKVLGKRKRR